MGTEPNPKEPPVPTDDPPGDPPEPIKDPDAVLAKNRELLAANRKLRDKLEKREADDKKAREKDLAEKERFKELWESEKEAHASTKTKFLATQSEITDAKKFAAFQNAVGQAIPSKYHALVDIDQIKIDEDTGKPSADSVKAYAETWKAEYGGLFSKTPHLPNDFPKDGGNPVPSIAEWQALAKTDPKKHRELMPAVFERHKDSLGRST